MLRYAIYYFALVGALVHALIGVALFAFWSETPQERAARLAWEHDTRPSPPMPR